MKSLTIHIARTNILSFISFAIQALRGFVLIPLFLRVVGMEEYGRWVIVMSWTGYALIVLVMGLDISIYQFVTPHISAPRGRAIYWTIIRIAAVWVAIVLGLTFIPILVMAPRDIALTFLCCGLYVAGQVAWTLFLAPFRCEERTTIYFLSNALITFGDLCLTVTTLYATHSLLAIFFVLAAYHLTIGAFLFLIQRRRFPPLPFAREVLGASFRFGGSITITQLMTTGCYVLDRSIILLFGGLRAVAIYAPPMALALALMPLNASGTISLPTLLVSKEAANSEATKRHIFRSALKQWSLLAFPAAVGIAIVARPVLEIIANHHIAEIGAVIAWIAAPAVIIDGLGRFAFTALRAEGDINWINIMKAVQFIGYLAGAALLSLAWPENTYYIIVTTLLATNVAYTACSFLRLRRYISRAVSLQTVASALVGSVAILFIAAVMPKIPSLAWLLAFVALCVLVYASVIVRMEHISLRHLGALIGK